MTAEKSLDPLHIELISSHYCMLFH